MNYEDARTLIKTGDVIIVRGTTGFLTPFTKFFTRSPYTHTGQAFWLGDVLWMNEINGGKNHAIPLSQLADEDFDVFERPNQVSEAGALAAIKQVLRTRIPYSLLALFMAGLLDFFRIKAFIHWRQLLVCSGYTTKSLCLAGWPECTYILSPADLAAMLKLKLAVRVNDAPLAQAA
jgi:hypothetical protein